MIEFFEGIISFLIFWLVLFPAGILFFVAVKIWETFVYPPEGRWSPSEEKRRRKEILEKLKDQP